MTTLKVTRTKDRAAMAAIVHDIFSTAARIAALETIPEGENSLSPRRCAVEFTHGRGIAVSVEFDGDSSMDRAGTFCMAWHTIVDTDARMSEAFGRAVCGSVNPRHFSKCTTFAHGFDDLCATLHRAVDCLNSGEAYDAERETAGVVKNGTWQERAARWEQYRREFNASKTA